MALLFRFGLRIAALALKFVLSIAIARTLGFEGVTEYGLALAVSVVSSKLLGLGFSAELNRRLSASDPRRAIDDIKRVMLCYGAAYGLIVALVLAVRGSTTFAALGHITPGVLWGVMLVAFSEHAGAEANSWVFSLHRARAGAVFLFLRTGAWAAVAIVALLSGATHSIEAVFTMWWTSNVLVVITACAFIVRVRSRLGALPRNADSAPYPGVRSIWIDGLPFFIATTVLSALQYAERFVASGLVSANELGRYVFVWSIANTIQTIAYATIVVTAGPRLVRSLDVSTGEFRAALRRAIYTSVAISTGCAVGVLVCSKPVFSLSHQDAGAHEYALLSILLVSFILRAVADVCWSGAIAMRMGKQVSAAICAWAVVCVPCAWGLISCLGTLGAALVHLCTSAGIVVILVWLVARSRVISADRFIKKEATHAS